MAQGLDGRLGGPSWSMQQEQSEAVDARSSYTHHGYDNVNQSMVLSSMGEIARRNPGNGIPRFNSPSNSPTFSDHQLPIPVHPLPETTIPEDLNRLNIRSSPPLDISSSLSKFGGLEGLPNVPCDSYNSLRRKLKDQMNLKRQNQRPQPQWGGVCRNLGGYNGSAQGGYGGGMAAQSGYSGNEAGGCVANGGGWYEGVAGGGLASGGSMVGDRIGYSVPVSAHSQTNTIAGEEMVGVMYNDPLWSQDHSQDRNLVSSPQVLQNGQAQLPLFTVQPSYSMGQGDILAWASQRDLEEINLDDVLACLNEGESGKPNGQMSLPSSALPPPVSDSDINPLNPDGSHLLVTGQTQLPSLAKEPSVCHLGSESEYADIDSGMLDDSGNVKEDEQYQHIDYLNSPGQVMGALLQRQCSIHDEDMEPSESFSDGNVDTLGGSGNGTDANAPQLKYSQATNRPHALALEGQSNSNESVMVQQHDEGTYPLATENTADTGPSHDIEESFDLVRLMRPSQRKYSHGVGGPSSTNAVPSEGNGKGHDPILNHPLHNSIKHSPDESANSCHPKSTSKAEPFARPYPVSHAPAEPLILSSNPDNSDGSTEQTAGDVDSFASEEFTNEIDTFDDSNISNKADTADISLNLSEDSDASMPSSLSNFINHNLHCETMITNSLESSSTSSANVSNPGGITEKICSHSVPITPCNIAWTEVFQSTSHVTNDQLVHEFTVGRSIPEVRRMYAPFLIEELSQYYQVSQDHLENCPPLSLDVTICKRAKLCKAVFYSNEMRISIHLPCRCIRFDEWLLQHSSDHFEPTDRQLVGQQVLLLLAVLHGHEEISLWGGFSVWIDDTDVQVYLKPEFPHILSKMENERWNGQYKPRVDDVRTIQRILHLLLQPIRGHQCWLSPALRVMLQYMNEVMADTSSCYYRVADMARAWGSRRICQLAVAVEGKFFYGCCLEGEGLLEALRESLTNQVQRRNWKLFRASSNLLVKDTDTAVPHLCIQLHVIFC